MADRKPALYYALVFGYHPILPGRIMAVTSETVRKSRHPQDQPRVVMLNGRDEEGGTSTRRNPADVTYRFKDWAEVEAFEADCRRAKEEIEAKHSKVLKAHEFHRRMMLKFDKAASAARAEVGEAKLAILNRLKEQEA